MTIRKSIIKKQTIHKRKTHDKKRKTDKRKQTRKQTRKHNQKRKQIKRRQWFGGAKLQKGIKADPKYNLIQVNTNNNKAIYQINNGECIQYFYVKDEQPYILLYDRNSDNILFKLGDDDTIDKEIYTTCERFLSYSSIASSFTMLASKLDGVDETKGKILVVKKYCKPYMSEEKLFRAKEKIKELNELLKLKCGNLSLNLDYVYKLQGTIATYTEPSDVDTLVLCLYNNNNCISSIELNEDEEGNLQINSKTISEFEGKKYNKLLRGVVIIIASLIDGVQKIVSDAINPISAWLLISAYNAVIPPDNDENISFYKFLSTKADKTITQKTLQEFKEYDKLNFRLYLFTELNEINVRKSYDMFRSLVDVGLNPATQIQCE